MTTKAWLKFSGCFGRTFELSGGTFSAELHDVLANDEQAVALYTGRAERAGKHWEDNIALVIHIRDGKVTEDCGSIQLTNMAGTSSGRNRHHVSHQQRQRRRQRAGDAESAGAGK